MADQLPGRLFLDCEKIQGTIDFLALEIAMKYRDVEVLVPVLSGAMLFAADLLKALAVRGIHPSLLPIVVKRDMNRHGTPVLQNTGRSSASLAAKKVLVVDTICDSGHTARYVMKHIWLACHAADARFACLFNRDPTNLPDGFLSYVGCQLETDEYLYGYGLDRNGRYRGLPDVYAEHPSAAVSESVLVPEDKG